MWLDDGCSGTKTGFTVGRLGTGGAGFGLSGGEEVTEVASNASMRDWIAGAGIVLRWSVGAPLGTVKYLNKLAQCLVPPPWSPSRVMALAGGRCRRVGLVQVTKGCTASPQTRYASLLLLKPHNLLPDASSIGALLKPGATNFLEKKIDISYLHWTWAVLQTLRMYSTGSHK